MSKLTYFPERGDLIEMNFQPAAGREIDKRRPAIVLSPKAYSKKSGLCVAVPTTTVLTPNPLWIPMPPGYLSQPSLILCDYVKSFDFRERAASYLNRIPEDVMQQIVSNLLDLIDPVA